MTNSVQGAADWRDGLVYRKGKIVPCVANIALILRHDPCWVGVLATDDFRGGATCALKRPPWDADCAPAHATDGIAEWTDTDDARLEAWLVRHWGICGGFEVVHRAVEVAARSNPFHPVVDYLDRLRWDGEPRIDAWLATYLGAEDTNWARVIGAKWLISGVARVRRPGCKADHVLVLEGPQGKLKSSALQVLAGSDWFTDEIATLGSKDAAMQLAGRLIVEFGEFGPLNKQAPAASKAFVTRSSDRYRPPYGRRVITVPRQCIFAATVNHHEYLRDETGGRRFWPVRVGVVALDDLKRDRDQLWAEADARFADGEMWWLEAEDATLAAQEVESRFQADVWEEPVQNWLARHPGRVGIADILTRALDIPSGKQERTHEQRVRSILRRLGYQPSRIRPLVNGQRPRTWEPAHDGLAPVGENDPISEG